MAKKERHSYCIKFIRLLYVNQMPRVGNYRQFGSRDHAGDFSSHRNCRKLILRTAHEMSRHTNLIEVLPHTKIYRGLDRLDVALLV